MEEITDSWIITITKNGFTSKMLLIMFKFIFHIRELRVEFVFFIYASFR